MTMQERIKLVTLGQQLSTLGVEVRMAQIGLKNVVENYGMHSRQTVEALHLYQELATQFEHLEQEFLALKEKYSK